MISTRTAAVVLMVILAGSFVVAQPAYQTQTGNDTTTNTTQENETADTTADTDTATAMNDTDETNNIETNTAVNNTEEEAALEENVSADVDANVSTVIVASTENYPDASIASAAAAKTGSPMILTENDTMSDETQDALSAFNPDRVVLVGGPHVLSTNISDALETAGYDTTRLWGFTRYGTSVEVAEYFWPAGADEAVIVQDDRNDRNDSDRGDRSYRTVSAAAELAQADGNPLYITPSDVIPGIVFASLQNLGIEQLTLVGTNMSDAYFQSLDETDITVGESVTAETEEELQAQLADRTREDVPLNDNLVVVASDGYEYVLVAANAPDALLQPATTQNETRALLDELDRSTVDNITVIGDTDRVQNVSAQLEDTDATVRTVTGSADDIISMNNRFVHQNAETFTAASRAGTIELERERDRNERRVRQRVAALMVQTEQLIGDDAPAAANETLDQAMQQFQEQDYIAALQDTMAARNIVRLDRYQQTVGTPAYEEQVMAEMQSLAAFQEQIRRMNPTFATAFEQASLGTQLWIVESVRSTPQEEQELIFAETASTLEEEEIDDAELLPRFEQARERVQTGNLTVNQTNQTQVNATNQTTVNVTNQTTVNATNETGMNETNVTSETNVTNTTTNTTTNETTVAGNETNVTNETLTENESTETVTISGESFDFETRCQTGDAEDSYTIRSSSVHNAILVSGQTVLPTPNFNATSNVSVDENNSQANVTVNFTERDGVGLQCVGEGTFRQSFNVSDGTWDVDLTVNVGNETIIDESGTVQVPATPQNETGNQTGNETSETNDTTDAATTNETGEEAGAVEAQEISLVDNAFQPAAITTDQGDVLVFVNNGDSLHSVTIPELGVDQDLQPGEDMRVELDQTGTFDLRCTYHEPEMTGQITVS